MPYQTSKLDSILDIKYDDWPNQKKKKKISHNLFFLIHGPNLSNSRAWSRLAISFNKYIIVNLSFYWIQSEKLESTEG